MGILPILEACKQSDLIRQFSRWGDLVESPTRFWRCSRTKSPKMLITVWHRLGVMKSGQESASLGCENELRSPSEPSKKARKQKDSGRSSGLVFLQPLS